MPNRIVIIGGAGEMIRVAIDRLARYEPGIEFLITDIDIARAELAVQQLPTGMARAQKLDLFDTDNLRNTIRGSDLVINAAGPYMRTAEPVTLACAVETVNYLDFDDDPSSTLSALDFDEQAKAAGISVMIGCGASPGWTNVLAVDVCARLDTVDSIDTYWLAGDEDGRPFGAAVLEHCLEMVSGEAVSWRDGKRVRVPLGDSEIVSLGGEAGDTRLYEVAHPEPITLPRKYRDVRQVRCLGGFAPTAVNGVFQGLATAVSEGKLTMPDAIEFLQQSLSGGSAPSAGWPFALGGMWNQVQSSETNLDDMFNFLRGNLSSSDATYSGAMMVSATGLKDGSPTTITRRLGGTAAGWKTMADTTGSCTAAFVSLALRQKTLQNGVLAPEDWVDPDAFFATLVAHGAPEAMVLDPTVTTVTTVAGFPSEQPG